MRGNTTGIFAFLVVAFSPFAGMSATTRADVVAAYELTDPAVVPGGGVVAVTQGGPGQALEITLDDTPGDHTLKILFVADVDAATALYGYSMDLTTAADTVAATALEYLGPFDYQIDPPDLVLSAGPGTIVDDASQGALFAPPSGMLEMFELTLVVSVPTADVQIYSKLGEYAWASIADPFLITIADSDPLSSYTLDTTTTPSIIIRVSAAPLDDCNTNGMSDSEEIAAQPSADCNGNGTIDVCEIAGGTVDCDSNGILDSCEITAGSAVDCDWNGTLDRCEIASGATADCNANGRPDPCDLASGASADINGNGIPDECESNETATPQEEQTGPASKVVDRQSLRTFLAMILGVPGMAGYSLSSLPLCLGPIGIPMSVALQGLELVNLPSRIVVFELTYAVLDALLP